MKYRRQRNFARHSRCACLIHTVTHITDILSSYSAYDAVYLPPRCAESAVFACDITVCDP